MRSAALVWGVVALAIASPAAAADPLQLDVPSSAQPRVLVDRVAVRFFAPETGGARRPRFITERTLAFEARLETMSDEAANGGGGGARALDERHLRSALDRHVVEEILAALLGDVPAGDTSLAGLAREAQAETAARVGGASNVERAAEAEGLGPDEVAAIFERRARAATYLDQAAGHFLKPTEDQLREAFRAGGHPFHSGTFDDVRAPLARWVVFERLKVLESGFLQTARTRITTVIVPR